MITDEEARKYQDKLNECLDAIIEYCRNRDDCVECPLYADACNVIPHD